MAALARSQKCGFLRSQSSTKQELRCFSNRSDTLLDLTPAREFLQVFTRRRWWVRLGLVNSVLALKSRCKVGMDRNIGHYGEKQLLAESGETQFLDNHRTGKTKSTLERGTEQGLGHKHKEKAFRCERTPPPNLRALERIALE